MARKPAQVTRTFGPIHFEDLDAHRFEDLVRELIYDFREWQSIEATGRSGSDGGFDVRAYERNTVERDSDSEEMQRSHPMEGNCWMIQGKREKELGPTAVKKILSDVDEFDPPYGYILAASAVFSKESYDAFRQVLREKGVMEFYLWGRPELEDMLHLPKNDRILFTFFGFSLATKRRSRTTEVRSVVTIKNRLQKLLGSPEQEFHATVLLRDITDDKYPYRAEYKDFEERPRWMERTAFRHHPLGFWVHARKHYAYVDRDKRVWDFTREADLIWPQVISAEDRDAWHDRSARVKDIWNFLPRSKKAELAVESLVKYDDVFVVDGDGDSLHHFPHIYAEFSKEGGPYSRHYARMTVDGQFIDFEEEGWSRIEFFPKPFPTTKPIRNQPSGQQITLDAETLKGFIGYGDDADTLFTADKRYDALRERDVVAVGGASADANHYVRVTHIRKTTLGEFLRFSSFAFKARRFATQQIGREVSDDEEITIVEVDRAYPHEWAQD